MDRFVLGHSSLRLGKCSREKLYAGEPEQENLLLHFVQPAVGHNFKNGLQPFTVVVIRFHTFLFLLKAFPNLRINHLFQLALLLPLV